MRKISILGAGWLGMALTKELLKRGDVQVMASTRNEERKVELMKFALDLNVARLKNKEQSLTSPNLKLYAISLPNVTLQDTAFFKADTLVVTIPPGRRREHAQEMYTAEIIATLKYAKENKTGSIIYTSSTGIYGNTIGQVIETTPAAPATASAQAVLAAEELIKKSGIPSTVLRLAGLFGPDRHPGRWFGGKPSIPNGDAPVNLVHQADVVSAILAVINQNAWNKTYNVCASSHPAKGSFYAKAAAQLGLGIPASLPGGGDGKWVDNRKLREELGWEPKHELLTE